MQTNRRAFLKTSTGIVVLLASGGAWWGLTRAPKQAREPWRRAAEGFGDPRLDVLAYAILAPNPHNMQPWQVRLEQGLSFSVFCDPDRLLPQTDPPNRQITIGFGCFLELVRQAALEKGFRAEIEYFPEGEPQPVLDARPIAHVRLMEDEAAVRDPLFGNVLTRRTNREPFDLARPVSEGSLQKIRAATVSGVDAFTSADRDLVSSLRGICSGAWRIEWEYAATRRESIAVSRIGKEEINAQPYGLAMQGPVMEGLAILGLLSREGMNDPSSAAFKGSLDYYTKACETAMAFVWTTTDSNTRHDQLEAGRAWVRMQLAADAEGVAFHPLSQALQEFPVMGSLYELMHETLTRKPGETIQMLCRLGYADTPHEAPREPLDSKLLTG